VKSKSLDILNHKLVENLINHYWRYVIWQWIILRSVYLFITVMLTVFTLVLPHPRDDICECLYVCVVMCVTLVLVFVCCRCYFQPLRSGLADDYVCMCCEVCGIFLLLCSVKGTTMSMCVSVCVWCTACVCVPICLITLHHMN